MRRIVLFVVLGVVSLSCATQQYRRDTKWVVKPRVAPAGAKPERADNSFCYVCHINYEPEKLNAVHQKAGVGCETCHGISDRHSEDEDSMVAPDILWPKHRITGRCVTCHPIERLLASKEAAGHRQALDPRAGRHCTQCHGKKHRLKNRARVWDKETGKLLKWIGGPRMDKK
ncbi:hypothetical protein HQ560_08610 [bacterium]|nr:hypothetical protein [bacterium]